MKRKLADTLARIDKPTETWTSPDASAALVLPMVDASCARFGRNRSCLLSGRTGNRRTRGASSLARMHPSFGPFVARGKTSWRRPALISSEV